MSEQLKNCPICDNNVVPIETGETWNTKCGECGLKTEKFNTRFQLVTYWNTRPKSTMGGDFKEMLTLQREIKGDIAMIKFIAQRGNEQLPPPPEETP